MKLKENSQHEDRDQYGNMSRKMSHRRNSIRVEGNLLEDKNKWRSLVARQPT
jgi:hypothetical protein